MESLRDSTRSASISVASVFMRHVYQWMTVGLLVTAGAALFFAASPAPLSAPFAHPPRLPLFTTYPARGRPTRGFRGGRGLFKKK